MQAVGGHDKLKSKGEGGAGGAEHLGVFKAMYPAIVRIFSFSFLRGGVGIGNEVSR